MALFPEVIFISCQYFLESTKVLLREYCSTGLKVLVTCSLLFDKELWRNCKT